MKEDDIKMFNKKKTTYINSYDSKWNDIVNRRHDAMNRIDELYNKMKCSIRVKMCFEVDSPNWKAEDKHLKDLRYQMLCVCGTFDGTSYDLKELWKNHKTDLQPEFCMNYEDLDDNPVGDCNVYLRDVVKRIN